MNHSPVYGLKKKDAFCDQVINLVATVPEYEMLLLCGDMENTRTVLKKNQDGLHLLNFFVADQLAIAKALFRNIVININIIIIVIIIIITYYYENVRVIGSEECIIQHKLLICEITLSTKSVKPPYIPLQRKT